MLFLQAREKMEFEEDLTKIFSMLLDSFIKPNVGDVSSVGMKKVVLRRTFENLWLSDNRKYWEMDQKF